MIARIRTLLVRRAVVLAAPPALRSGERNQPGLADPFVPRQ